MSSNKSTVEQLEIKLAQQRAKIAEVEARRRKEDIALEKDQAAIITQGNACFNEELVACAKRAIGFVEAARDALAKLPAAPVKPDVELVNTIGFDAWLAESEAFPAKEAEHRRAVAKAIGSLGPALRGLSAQASAIRRQGQALGFTPFEGCGFLREDQHQHPSNDRALVLNVANAAEAGDVSLSQIDRLLDLLNMPKPVGPEQKPELTHIAWQRLSRSAEERALAASGIERVRAPLRGEQDADNYVRGLGTTGGKPLFKAGQS